MFCLVRWLDAFEYGSGLDYKYHPSAKVTTRRATSADNAGNSSSSAITAQHLKRRTARSSGHSKTASATTNNRAAGYDVRQGDAACDVIPAYTG